MGLGTPMGCIIGPIAHHGVPHHGPAHAHHAHLPERHAMHAHRHHARVIVKGTCMQGHRGLLRQYANDSVVTLLHTQVR